MKRILISVLMLFLLSACAETELASHVVKQVPYPGQGQNQGLFKVGKPYSVDGQVYTPKETYQLTETGIASWYGPGFQGKKTANGERFDMNELTAAHRTLQMPSLVRVTNLENGRSLIVRINDRGPFKRNRVIDVSKKAANLLGFIGQGTARVRLDLLADESRTLAMAARRGEDTRGTEVAMNATGYKPQQPNIPPGHVEEGRFLPDPVVTQYPVSPTSIYVQIGAFSNRANAEGLAQKLSGFGNVGIYPAMVRGQQFFRVRIGPIGSVETADGVHARVIKAGHREATLIVD